MTVVVFDGKQYVHRQIVEALLCPINRYATCREHECDEWGLFKHPNWLIEHYEANGGAIEFAKHRAEFFREVEIPDEIEFQI